MDPCPAVARSGDHLYVVVSVREWRRLFRAIDELRCFECDLRVAGVSEIPEPRPIRLAPPRPAEICRFCHEPIEFGSELWWKAGTCGSDCGPSPDHLHRPVEVDLRDQAALERWLDS